METILQLKKLLIIPMFLLVVNVWGQVIIPVPFISQGLEGCPSSTTSNFGTSFCGHTSAEMIMGYFDPHTLSTSNIQNYNTMVENQFHSGNHNSCGTGTPNPNHLIWLFNQFGYNSTWYGTSNLSYGGNSGTKQNLQDLINELNNGNIVMFQCGLGSGSTTTIGMQSQAHWMILKGYDSSSDEIIVNDPGKSQGFSRRYSKSSFDNSWANSYKICLVVQPKKNEINQSLPIYAGSMATPKELKLVIEDPQFSFNVNQISEIKITSSTGIVRSISNLAINGSEQFSVANPDGSNKDWRLIKILPVSSELNAFTNSRGYKISFKLTQGSSVKTYQNNDLYFEDFYSPTSLQDLSDLDNWVAGAVRIGANMGLYRGPSATQFNPSENLTRAQAATVLVNLATRLRLLNVVTTGNQFSDVSSSHPFFKYIQTLKNYGHITSNTDFNPDSFITVGEFCKMIANVLNIQSSDYAPAPYLNYLGRKIIVSSSNTDLADAMNKLLKIVDITDTNGFWITNNAWDFFDFSSISQTSSFYTVTGTSYVSRAKMAKVLLNLANWKSSQIGVSLRTNNTTFSTSNLSDIVSLGEKYDNASITATSTPVIPTQQTYSVNSGGSITILYNPSSLPQHYYWSMLKNGATLTSNNSAHSSVTFTAPIVTSPTQWKLYTYTANNKGKARESFITINVGGSSSGGNSFPTQQASNIQVTANNNQTNYIGLSWVRGNGQNCIVTATPLPNSESLPQDGQTYSHNQNIQLAASIGNTKVVYQGTANTVNIVNLTQNTDYKFTVYEYNGTNYNVTNAPSITERLEPLPPYNTSISYTPSTIVTGQSVTFCVNSENNCNTIWSNSGGSATTNGTSCQDVIFSTAGTYTVSVVATECGTNVTDNDGVIITVYNPNQLEPDFIVQNLTSNKTATSVGQNVTVNYSVTNTGLVNGYLTDVNYYISNDNSLSVDDILVLNDPYNTPYQINSNNSVNLSKTIDIPNSVSLGNKFIIVQADGQNAEIETNENNNTASLALNVVNALPDLIITSANLPNGSTYASGVAIPISVTVGNLGTTSSNLQCFFDVFLSPNGNISNPNNWNEAVLHTGTGNYPQNLTLNPVFPSSLPNGTYTVFVVVDHQLELL